MKKFIDNAASVLKKNSHDIDLVKFLTGSSWVLVDGKYDDEVFFFQEKGEVKITKDKHDSQGKWEFVPASSKLIIEKTTGQFIYPILFADKAIIISPKDPISAGYTVFANNKLIPDLKVEHYIKEFAAHKMGFALVHTTEGVDLEIHKNSSEELVGTIGQQVTVDLEMASDGFYQSSTSSYIYEVQGGRIASKKHTHKITLSDGRPASHYAHNQYGQFEQGDYVFSNGVKLPSGKYFTGETWFVIEEGRVKTAGMLKTFKTGNGNLFIEQHDAKPAKGDIAYYEGGKPLDGEISVGLFKKIKAKGGIIE